jgi:hypothetical protein
LKVTDAVPPDKSPSMAPAGLPVCAAQLPVLGAVPAIFATVPAQTVRSTPALGLLAAVIVNESLQPKESVTTTL